jgi:hypothetical protein
MNLNLIDERTTAVLNAEIARRDSLPPFAISRDLPVAFLGVKSGIARVCAFHGRTHEGHVQNSQEATDWCTAQGLRVSHGACPACAARELAAIVKLPAVA